MKTISGTVNPMALRTLEKLRIPTDGFRSKDWSAFARPEAPTLDFVFTFCDNTAGEVCPVWPGQPMSAHWGVPDPGAAPGSDAQKTKLFWDTAVVIKRRLERMLALRLHALDRLSIQRAIKDIGTR